MKEINPDGGKDAAVQQEVNGVFDTIMNEAHGGYSIAKVMMEFVGMKRTKTYSELC